MCHSTCVEVKGQLYGVGSLLHLYVGSRDGAHIRLVWKRSTG